MGIVNLLLDNRLDGIFPDEDLETFLVCATLKKPWAGASNPQTYHVIVNLDTYGTFYAGSVHATKVHASLSRVFGAKSWACLEQILQVRKVLSIIGFCLEHYFVQQATIVNQILLKTPLARWDSVWTGRTRMQIALKNFDETPSSEEHQG